MESSYDVPDSTDWIGTSLPDLAALENALHCQICKEFYETPMITTCNHTFCSRCIRTSLSSDGRCPACRTSDQASKLRNNWAIQEVVSTFLAARPKALEVARKAQEELQQPKRNGKRKRAAVLDPDHVAEAEASGRTTRSKSRRIATSPSSQPEPIEVEDSEAGEDEAYQPEPEPQELKDGMVACPLGCGKRMKEEEVFNHLDKCEDEQKQANAAKQKISLNSFAPKPPTRQNSRPQDRINELSYGMLKENALSKKLKEQGIPNFGSKQLMINRHKEWVNIWNANCDANHPRSRRELLHDLDIWERTQGGKAPQGNVLSGSVMRKDFDGASHAKRHHDDFSRLIADAKRKKNNPATKSAPTKDIEFEANGTELQHDETSPFFSSSQPVTLDQQDELQQAPQNAISPDSTDRAPYAHDPVALSHVREKVEAINAGKTIDPQLNEGFRIPELDLPVVETISISNSTSSLSAHNDGPRRSQQRSLPPVLSNSASESDCTTPIASGIPTLARVPSKDEHVIHKRSSSACDLPAHLNASSPKKVPMFAVPEQPFQDFDAGGTSASS